MNAVKQLEKEKHRERKKERESIIIKFIKK